MSLWDEIRSQPEMLRALSQRNDVDQVVDWMNRQHFDHVLIAARGTSDNAARYAQYLWGARNRLLVSLAAPSLFGVYQSPPRLDDTLVVGISQSGQSPDLLSVLDEAKRQGRPTLSLTNDSDSPMAGLADCHLDLGAGPERAVAATKSYTAQLFAIAAISAGFAGDAEMQARLYNVSDAASDVLKMSSDSAAGALRDVDRCVVLGRGYHHATAHEWALKIAELSYVVAQPFSAADFRHGPMAMVEPGLAVLSVATTGRSFEDVSELLEATRKAGARVIAISDRQDCPADQLMTIPVVEEWLSPIPAIIAAQLFTFQLTRVRGLDPDNPRGLSKVTKTM
jgi:glucosamine--fructose-6-phosphate aminotransferase (isomerizing)